MKEEHVRPFVAATVNTFETMLGETPAAAQPRLKKEPFPVYDVSGVIGISGDLVGTVVLSFPQETALKAVSKFVAGEFKAMGREVSDGIGEMTNIVAGSALPDLTGFRCSISLPTVVLGKSHEIRSPIKEPSMVVAFESSFGPFVLEVNLQRAEELKGGGR